MRATRTSSTRCPTSARRVSRWEQRQSTAQEGPWRERTIFGGPPSGPGVDCNQSYLGVAVDEFYSHIESSSVGVQHGHLRPLLTLFAQRQVPGYVDLPIEAALAKCIEDGLHPRVIHVRGPLRLRMDSRPDRINLLVDSGRVLEAARF